jgi:hypothetical protein
VVAVAKKNGLAVNGVDITMLLDDGVRPNRRKITRAVKQKTGERFMGDLYVAGFAPGGDTYRVDGAPQPPGVRRDVLRMSIPQWLPGTTPDSAHPHLHHSTGHGAAAGTHRLEPWHGHIPSRNVVLQPISSSPRVSRRSSRPNGAT